MFSRLAVGMGHTLIVIVMMTVIWGTVHDRKHAAFDAPHSSVAVAGLCAAAYFAFHYGLAWWKVRRSGWRRYRFYVNFVYPTMIPLVFVVFVSFFIVRLAYGLLAPGSVAAQRVMTVVLMVIAALLRIGFARVAADPADAR
jgi:hypothetical protein